MKWYFRFIIKDGKIVDEKDITENIDNDRQWGDLIKIYEGYPTSERADGHEGILYYATVDDNDL